MTENAVKKASPKKHEGIMKYDKTILGVCNAEHFSLLNETEKNGYYGVAMLLAYQEGSKPNLKEFAYRLRVSPYLLEEAFNNLRANGVFSPLYKQAEVNPDSLKANENSIVGEWMKAKRANAIEALNFELAWVAGVASGLCGLK